VRTILAVGLAGLLGGLLFFAMHADVPFTTPASSQIFIHGTPVCVTQEGNGIVARLGECGETKIRPDETFRGKVPFDGHPGMNLPPGHPPIDGGIFPEKNRRVLI